MGCFHYTRGIETCTMLALSTAPWFRSTSLIDFPKELVVLGLQSHIRKPFKQTLLLKVPVSLWSFVLHQLSWFNGLCGLYQICVTIWFKSALGEERVVISCNRMRLHPVVLNPSEWVSGTVRKWKTLKLVLKVNNPWHERTHLSITLHVLQ